MKTLKVLEKFMIAEIAVDLDKKSLQPEEDLLGSGIIDSMAVLKVILFMEETFSIHIAEEDIVPENFHLLFFR